MPVIRPLVSRSHTSDTATPCPQPTSNTRSAGSSARVSTAHTNRSEGLLATPKLSPFRTVPLVGHVAPAPRPKPTSAETSHSDVQAARSEFQAGGRPAYGAERECCSSSDAQAQAWPPSALSPCAGRRARDVLFSAALE